jgi:ribosome-binding protein aMBF1 (putative translation factor)
MNILDKMLARITPQKMAQTERRMGIPILIDDAMKAQGLSHGELAKKINRKTNDIPLLLSGQYNFTVEELTTIELALNTKLFFVKELDWEIDVSKHQYQLGETVEYSVAAEP